MFFRSSDKKYAVERLLITIGEVAGKISKELLKDSSYTEWVKAIGMRNKLVHDYEHVNYVTVYEVATQEMKPMLEEVVRMIELLQEKYKDEL